MKVTLADSLRPGDLGKVAGEISETLRAGTAPPDCSFVSGCEAFDVAASPIGPDAHLGVSQDEVEEFISRRFGFSTPHLLVSFRPNKAAVIVGVRSLKAR